MRRLLVATRLVMLVQARGYFPHVFAVYCAVVIAVLKWLIPENVTDLVLPAFLVSEPGILGFSMVAAHRYLERGNGSVSALNVSPLRTGEYLGALLIGSAVLTTVAGSVTFALIVGVDARLIWLTPILFVFALFSGLVGFLLSLRYADFPRFMLGSVPVIGFWQAPLLAVYGLVPAVAVAWIPSTPGILAMADLCRGDFEPAALAALLLLGLGLTALGFWLVLKLYERRLHGGMELT